MNEYRVMMLSLGFLLLSLLIINASASQLASDTILFRRSALLNNLVRGAVLFWPVIYTPLCKYAKRDNDYADSFTAVRLAPSITPAMLRYCTLALIHPFMRILSISYFISYIFHSWVPTVSKVGWVS